MHVKATTEGLSLDAMTAERNVVTRPRPRGRPRHACAPPSHVGRGDQARLRNHIKIAMAISVIFGPILLGGLRGFTTIGWG
jgi:hypothetical protein